MKPCAKRTTTISGAHWLRVAESMARNLKGRSAKKYRVVDGYVLEGSKAGNNLKATVVDPPSRIAVDYLPVAKDGGGWYLVGYHDCPRDLLFPAGLPADGFQLSQRASDAILTPMPYQREAPPYPAVVIPTGWSAHLIAGDPSEITLRRPKAMAAHGAVELDNGYMAYGYTTFREVLVDPPDGYANQQEKGQPELWCAPYRRKVNALFSFGVTHAAFRDKVRMEDEFVPDWEWDPEGYRQPVTGPEGLGLQLDVQWIEQHLGGGAQLSLDDVRYPGGTVALPLGHLFTAEFVGMNDAADVRYVAPWAVGLVKEFSAERVVWRVLTRYTTERQGPNQFCNRCALAWFDVSVERSPVTGLPVATPGPVTRYEPWTSSDWRFRPQAYPEPSSTGLTGYYPNSFGAPVVGAGATAIIPYRVRNAFELPDSPESPIRSVVYNHAVLLKEDGSFQELDLPSGVGQPQEDGIDLGGEEGGEVNRNRHLFVGGAKVGDDLLYLNPFSDRGACIVNAVTGLVRTFEPLRRSDGYWVPNQNLDTSGGVTLRRAFAEPLLRNMCCWYGGRKLAFPVGVDDMVNHHLATIDVDTLEVEILGRVVDGAPSLPGQPRYFWHLTKPHAVQRWIPARDDQQEVPAILLWGYSTASFWEGYAQMTTIPSGRVGGVSLSKDGGLTWHKIIEQDSPTRAVWFAHNQSYRKPFGQLWRADKGAGE